MSHPMCLSDYLSNFTIYNETKRLPILWRRVHHRHHHADRRIWQLLIQRLAMLMSCKIIERARVNWNLYYIASIIIIK